MSDSIDKMAQGFKDEASLKAYSEAQYKTIVTLSKQNHQLEEENIHLRKLLEDSTPLIKPEGSLIETFQDVTDQEAICRMELKKLKNLAIERDLNLEEAKRTEIYTKLLVQLQQKGKPEEKAPGRLDDAQLIALFEKENGTSIK